MSKLRECGTKTQYRTRSEAEGAMWNLKRSTLALNLNVYRCSVCDFWHFGHIKRRRR